MDIIALKKAVQRKLAAMGFYNGEIDGEDGIKTWTGLGKHFGIEDQIVVPPTVEAAHYILGICDINHNNSFPIDLLTKQGFFVLIHKVSQGTSFRDSLWKTRRQQAEKAGWKVGGYHFTEPGHVKEQADNFLLHGDFGPDNAVVIDWEPAKNGSMSLEEVEIFSDFITTRLGRRPIVYGGRGLLNEEVQARLDRGEETRLSESPLWSVDFRSTPMPTSYPAKAWPQGPILHQYAGDNIGVNFLPKTIPGCEAGLDLDRAFFPTKEEFLKGWPF